MNTEKLNAAPVPNQTVSVRDIVEFILRCGSITPGGGGDVQDMLAGSATHRKLQKQAKDTDPGYEAEVRLQSVSDCGDLTLTVRGSADGVSRADGARVYEYKTVSCPAPAVPESERVLHWGQLLCYGHMLCESEGLERVSMRLVYYENETGTTAYFDREQSAESLAAFFADLCSRYAVWVRWRMAHEKARDASSATLAFPFDGYRRGQRTVAAEVYRAIRDKACLFVEAPTGIGKTMAVLYPAFKALGEGHGDRVFYLTAKTVTRGAAMNALAALQAGGLDCRALLMLAKEKLCPNGLQCDPALCPLADGYFDRARDAVFELLTTKTLFTPDDMREAAERYRVCPFELSLDLSSWCDAVIGDYSHLFDPVARLARHFAGDASDHIVLLDEAHNLVERGRDCFSASLSRVAVDDASKLVKKDAPKLYKSLRKLAACFRARSKAMKTESGANIDREETSFPDDVAETAAAFVETFKSLMRDERFAPHKEATLPLFFTASLFGTVAGLYDDKYTTYWERVGRDLVVRLFCVDPSRLLHQHYKKCRSVVLFSATLLPLEYYRRALTDEPIRETAVPSPFPAENQLVLFDDAVSTRYRDRENSLAHVGEAVLAAVSRKVGNYILYLPSFAYRDRLLEYWEGRDGLPELLVQAPGMGEEARADFLAAFERFGDVTRLGVCVAGGVFAEGVDLVGERLSGVIVVGVGLPTVSFENGLVRDHFERACGQGYDCAFRYPGMNRVFQCAGRVIRSPGDRGFVLLVDDRFGKREYIAGYPAHWANNRRVRTPEEIASALDAFWQGKS